MQGLNTYRCTRDSDPPLRLGNSFYCENDEDKAAWLQGVTSTALGTRSFVRAENVGKDRAYCRRMEALCDVPHVHILEAGYSCKDLSDLNADKDELTSRITEYLDNLTLAQLDDNPEWEETRG